LLVLFTNRNVGFTKFEKTTLNAILEFREALDFLGGDKPFSLAFGTADTRALCMESAGSVYRRLLLSKPESQILHFDTFVDVLARDKEGRLKKDKVMALSRFLRPNRKGEITMLNFLKSCDKVYKQLRMFRATVMNSAQLDNAFEFIMNIFFYLIVSCVILQIVFAINPTTLLLGMVGLLVPFSFAISNASSKWFEGVLLVLVRKPYDIGDRIALSNPESDTSSDGSTTWFVENITLFSTTVRMAASNEVATYNNGYLTGLRIINAARSPKAQVFVNLKFGMDVAYERVKIFHSVVENFVKERPQEWIKLAGFRATGVHAGMIVLSLHPFWFTHRLTLSFLHFLFVIDLGYINYVIVLQHIESWQNIGAILQSKADLSSFCLEVTKQMDMRFVSPPKPILLSLGNNSSDLTELSDSVRKPQLKSLEKLFQGKGIGNLHGDDDIGDDD